MDSMCGLGLSGNSSTASGRRDPKRTVAPCARAIVQAVGTSFFIRARFTSFHTHASLLPFFCSFVLFHSCCSHVRVFGKTLVHEFLICYSHTILLFFPTVQPKSSQLKRVLMDQKILHSNIFTEVVMNANKVNPENLVAVR